MLTSLHSTSRVAVRRLGLRTVLALALAQLYLGHASLALAADAVPAPSPAIDALAANGVTFRALYVNETAGNVSGGLRQGAAVSHYVVAGSDIDLEKAAGWSGTILHANIIAIKSRGLNQDYIGGGIDTQENYAPFPFVRFADLSLEKTLALGAAGKLQLQAGLMGASAYFARSAYACEFMNHAFCGAIWGLGQDTGTANTPLATWAARAVYRPSPHAYAQAGVFMSDTSVTNPDVHLFDFNKNRFTGRNWLLEAGHETTLADEEKPHYVRLGGWYLHAPRNDVYYNTKGQSYAIGGGGHAVLNYGAGAWLTAGKVIARPAPHGSANLAVFGSFLRSFSSAEPIASAAKFGIVQTGTFPGREHDAFMVGVADTRYSHQLVRYLGEKRSQNGGADPVSQHEYTVEVGYRAELRPGVMLTPNIQYELHPTNRTFPNISHDLGNPLVLGLKLTVDLGRIAGFSRPAR
jgi:porin